MPGVTITGRRILDIVVLVEIETEAEETQADVRMADQHDKESLHHVLKSEHKSVGWIQLTRRLSNEVITRLTMSRHTETTVLLNR